MLSVAAASTAIAAGKESRMLACRSLFRVNFLARRTTNIWVQSKPLLYVQKYKFLHGFSRDLMMGGRKKRVDIDPKRRKCVTQTWRPVSAQPNSFEGDSEQDKLQSRPGEMCDAISSNALAPEAESSNPEVLSEQIGQDENSVPSDKHSVSMEVGRSLMRFIKGKGGGTQEEIETETGVKITFPSSKTDDFIYIEGNSAECVTKASEKIQIIIDKVLILKSQIIKNTILGIATDDKDKNVDSDADGGTSDEEEEDQQSTQASSKVVVELEAKDDVHVKVNITSDQLSTKDAMNASVKVNLTDIPLVSYLPKEPKASGLETSSSKSKDSRIQKSIFIKPKTFHLTVLMLKLWNKDRVKVAAEVLQSVSSKVMDALENRPVSIKLKGLDSMRGSLAKARVLYAPVEEIGSEGRLLRACQIIIDAFVEAGLVIEKDVQQQLKLHATVMNARHRKRKKGSRKLDSFDARGIFDLYGSEEWGEYPIREAHLSQRFAYDENGYYHCCASIPFPDEMRFE